MNAIRSKLILFSSLLPLALTTGCFDTTEDFTLNPDGSGKVVHECKFAAVNFGNDKADSEETLRSAVREVIEKSKGVDAWRDITFKQLDDGRMLFRGTAYFKDLSKLAIPNQTLLEFDWKKTANGGVLSLRTNKSDSKEIGGGITMRKTETPAGTNQLSAEAMTKKIKESRMKYQQAKPMLVGFFGTMRQATTFHLPGTVAGSSNFGHDASGALSLKFEGAKLLEVIEKVINDDAWLRKHNGAGIDALQEKPALDDEIAGMIFGEKAPVRANVTAPVAPLFDYASEVAAAKKDFAKTEKELGPVSQSGSVAIASAPAAQGGPLKAFRIVGVRLVMESDSKRDLRPFNWEQEYSVSLLTEFPGQVLEVTDKTVLETALADDGSSLLPESDWDRKVHFPHLSSDKTAAILEFKLKVPGKGVRGLKMLSGNIQYKTSSATREVDLGVENLKAGSVGTQFGARIESIKEGWAKDGSQQMEIKLNLDPSDIKSVSMVVNGKKTELHQNGYGGGNKSFTFTYETSKQPFPEKARLVAELHDQLKTFETPFKLENISLLGASMP